MYSPIFFEFLKLMQHSSQQWLVFRLYYAYSNLGNNDLVDNKSRDFYLVIQIGKPLVPITGEVMTDYV
jgi:hypothetical protein